MSSTFAASWTFRSISARGQLAHLQREGEVLVDRFVRVERVVLEHHGDVAVLRVEIVDHAVADGDLAGGDRDQPGDQIERGRLAAAGRTDQRDELAVLDGQRHVVDRHDGAVGLDKISQDHLSHETLPSSCLTAPSVSARTKYLCRSRKSTTTGTLMMKRRRHQPGPVGRVLGEEALHADRQRQLVIVVQEGEA